MEDEIDLSTEEEVSTHEVTESEPKSMDDTIRETLAKIEARGESEEETAEQKAERVRDENGRFAKKNAEPVQPEGTEADTPHVEQVAAPVTVPPEIQRLGLRKEEAEAFANASQAVKDAFIRRSEEMHRGIEQFRSKAQLGHAMEQVLAPYQATMQSMGVTPDVAVQKLLSADHALRYGTPQQKQQMFYRIAQDYGIDLGQAQAEMPYVDPQVQTLQQQLQQLQGWVQQKTQMEEQREMQTLNSEIASFASKPENKYFEAVKNEMAGLLQAGIASTLQDAYDRAVYANPTTRAQLLAEQQAQADAKRKAELTAKAQDAKRAASVNLSKRGVMPSKQPIGTMEETIRATAERLGVL